VYIFCKRFLIYQGANEYPFESSNSSVSIIIQSISHHIVNANDNPTATNIHIVNQQHAAIDAQQKQFLNLPSLIKSSESPDFALAARQHGIAQHIKQYGTH